MRTSLYHLQLNVSDRTRSLPFYKALLEHLGYRTIIAGLDFMGMTNDSTDFWIFETAREYREPPLHRRRTGLNHLAFRAESRADVDAFWSEFLASHGIATLYGSPREYPEYAPGYYAVFFEDPDRLKLELAYVPPRAREVGAATRPEAPSTGSR